MPKAEIRAIVLMWIVGTALAIATGWFIMHWTDYLGGSFIPTKDTPITTWITHPVTPIAEEIQWLTGHVTMLVFPFLYAPLFILVYAIIKFGRDKSKHAAHWHEHLPLEIFWTIVPTLVLVAMSIPAFRTLRHMERPPDVPDHVVNVTGYQFYWQYELKKYDVIVTDDGTGKDPLVVPVNKMISLAGASYQVNHAWWVPAFGVKFDVIPGRITTGWFRAKQEGFFKGQCAELCGTLHAYMLIHVHVVPEKDFYQWILEKKGKIPADERAKVVALLGEETLKKYESK